MSHILVLDDDKIQHLLLRKRIKVISDHVQLICVERVDEALAYLSENKVDKVLTDLNLGSIDGWEFVEELGKVSFRGQVYLLTGSLAVEDRKRADTDPRISGFFEKPISEFDLIQILGA